MDNIVFAMIDEIYLLFIQMAPYLLFGFAVAGLLYVLIPRSLIIKHLKPNETKSIFKAALLGVPLPLCSCGVIPVAAHLRKQGANKSATVSFLASTPSTGADSIFATYSLMGPVYTVFRPIDALFSGFLAGLLVKIFSNEEADTKQSMQAKQNNAFKIEKITASPASKMPSSSCCSSEAKAEEMSSCCSAETKEEETSSCCRSEVKEEETSSCCSAETKEEETSSCCSSEVKEEVTSSCCSAETKEEETSSCCSAETKEEVTSSCCSSEVKEEVTSSCCSSEVKEEVTSSCCSSEAKEEAATSCCSSKQQKPTNGLLDKLKTALNYGLFELVDDTKKWILIGIVVGGILSWGIPDQLTSYWIEYPILSYLSMLVVGLPMYVCATASIPIATALLMNGLSPGAALVFLAVGPATNTATIAFLSSSMGKKSMFIYLFSISFSAILLGIIIDLFFSAGITEYFNQAHQHEHIGFWSYLFSAVLAGLIAFQYLKPKTSCTSN